MTESNTRKGSAANSKPADDKQLNEREKLRASLKQTLKEFKDQSALKEKKNGQGSQGGVKQPNNRLVGNYLVGKSPHSLCLISHVTRHNLICVLKLSGKTIGSGTFGKVREGIHQLTKEKVAIKILEKDKIKD